MIILPLPVQFTGHYMGNPCSSFGSHFSLAITGIYQCCKPFCKTCWFVKHGQKDFCVKGKTYPLKGFYTCSTDHVVYCLTCPCSLFYVGRTIRSLRKSFSEYHHFVTEGSDIHSVSRHFLKYHNKSTVSLKFGLSRQCLETSPQWSIIISSAREKCSWFYLWTYWPPEGLNEDFKMSTVL